MLAQFNLNRFTLMVKQGDKRENIVFLSVGTNLGDRFLNISAVEKTLQELSVRPILMSSIYESEPWGNDNLEPFLNCVIRLVTLLEPLELLQRTQQIEIEIGRGTKSKGGSYKNRVIDLDLLTFNQLTFNSTDLTIPHPFITERNFVLHPFVEIAPCYKLPYSKFTIAEEIEKCVDERKCSAL